MSIPKAKARQKVLLLPFVTQPQKSVLSVSYSSHQVEGEGPLTIPLNGGVARSCESRWDQKYCCSHFREMISATPPT